MSQPPSRTKQQQPQMFRSPSSTKRPPEMRNSNQNNHPTQQGNKSHLSELVQALQQSQKSPSEIDFILASTKQFCFFAPFANSSNSICVNNSNSANTTNNNTPSTNNYINNNNNNNNNNPNLQKLHQQAAQRLSYLFATKGTPILRSEQTSERFYILISGQVSGFEPSPALSELLNPKKRGNDIEGFHKNHNRSQSQTTEATKPIDPLSNPKQVYTIGSHFGDQGILYSQSNRLTLICTDDCHFAVLEKSIFLRIFKTYFDTQLQQQIKFLRNLPLFYTWPNSTIRALALNSSLQQFQQHEYVFQEASESNSSGIIISGTFCIMKKFEVHRGELRNQEINNSKPQSLVKTSSSTSAAPTITTHKGIAFNINGPLEKKPIQNMKIFELSPLESFGEADALLNKPRGFALRCSSLSGEILLINAYFLRGDLSRQPIAQSTLFLNAAAKQVLIQRRISSIESSVAGFKSFLCQDISQTYANSQSQASNRSSPNAAASNMEQITQKQTYEQLIKNSEVDNVISDTLIARMDVNSTLEKPKKPNKRKQAEVAGKKQQDVPSFYYYDGVPDETFPVPSQTSYFGFRMPQKLEGYPIIEEIRPIIPGKDLSSPIKISMHIPSLHSSPSDVSFSHSNEMNSIEFAAATSIPEQHFDQQHNSSSRNGSQHSSDQTTNMSFATKKQLQPHKYRMMDENGKFVPLIPSNTKELDEQKQRQLASHEHTLNYLQDLRNSSHQQESFVHSIIRKIYNPIVTTVPVNTTTTQTSSTTSMANNQMHRNTTITHSSLHTNPEESYFIPASDNYSFSSTPVKIRPRFKTTLTATQSPIPIPLPTQTANNSRQSYSPSGALTTQQNGTATVTPFQADSPTLSMSLTESQETTQQYQSYTAKEHPPSVRLRFKNSFSQNSSRNISPISSNNNNDRLSNRSNFNIESNIVSQFTTNQQQQQKHPFELYPEQLDPQPLILCQGENFISAVPRTFEPLNQIALLPENEEINSVLRNPLPLNQRTTSRTSMNLISNEQTADAEAFEGMILSKVMEHPSSKIGDESEIREIIDYYLTQSSLLAGTADTSQFSISADPTTTRNITPNNNNNGAFIIKSKRTSSSTYRNANQPVNRGTSASAGSQSQNMVRSSQIAYATPRKQRNHQEHIHRQFRLKQQQQQLQLSELQQANRSTELNDLNQQSFSQISQSSQRTTREHIINRIQARLLPLFPNQHSLTEHSVYEGYSEKEQTAMNVVNRSIMTASPYSPDSKLSSSMSNWMRRTGGITGGSCTTSPRQSPNGIRRRSLQIVQNDLKSPLRFLVQPKQ